MDSFDVLIVGAGPSGSSCAWKLSREGMSVLLLDKSRFPRDKPCAGWITPQVVTDLQIDADHYRQSRVWQPIRGFRTGLIGGNEVEITYSSPVSYGIRRCEFDAYLLDRSGARVRMNERVKTIELHGDRWVVNDRFCAPLLVGAGGHFCPVARMLGARDRAAASVVTAQEVEFEATREEIQICTVDSEMPELFFCRDLEGYGWCFRKGNHLNIGLGRRDSTELSKHVSEFCDFLRDRQKVPQSIPTRFKGHAYQLYQYLDPKLVGERVLLVGDAAGLAYPQSGEGIRPAVESGLIAADVILAAEGNYGHEHLTTYRDRIHATFGKPRSPSRIDWLSIFPLRSIATRLVTFRWFAKHIIMNNWFLHHGEPPLLSSNATDGANDCPIESKA